MRIISGKYKGRRINPPSNFSARPTTDYARESLFNILANRIDFEAVNILDLFAGTGSISYEFASRGAKNIHAVEKDPKHTAFIRRMVDEMKFDNIKPIHVDVKAYLKTCRFKYDIVFADPPFKLSWLDTLPDLVIFSGVIKDDGFFILEHPKDLSFTSNKFFFEHRNYGSVNFSFFRFSGNEME
ncbi:MAG: 16S rRNA (guanine(966)-N(2))-methyltransferase RsmD [Odoribacter sp.]|nr:16S rRNA (guanine(966)-N(2))-methyltransferase RsmD [Odoribacter sp.]